jgi:hypothetical protein
VTKPRGPKFLRVLSRAATAIAALALVVLLVGYTINVYARHRAELLLHDLQVLQVGASTAHDAMQIVSRYGGWRMPDRDPNNRDVAPWGIGPCSGPHPRYAIRIAPDLINRAVVAVPQLQHLGFHVWGVVSTIDVKDDVECWLEQDVGFQRPDGQEIEAEAQMVQEQLRPEDGKYSVQSQLIRNYIHSLNASVLPSASNEEKSRAFDVNLACVTRVYRLYVEEKLSLRSLPRSLRHGPEKTRCPAKRRTNGASLCYRLFSSFVETRLSSA